MFGTITLKGHQNKNIFVDEHGRTFRIINMWSDANAEVYKYVQLRKFNDDSWYLLRDLEISRRKIK